MYTREEASAIRQQFWTSLGQYLSPVPSASGNKINWINYKTGIRDIRFKMDADSKHAYIALQIEAKDEAKRTAYYAMLVSLKAALEQELGESWTWEETGTGEHGRTMARVYVVLQPVNIFRKEDWPALIPFFKERLTALDRFWNDHKDFFEMIAW